MDLGMAQQQTDLDEPASNGATVIRRENRPDVFSDLGQHQTDWTLGRIFDVLREQSVALPAHRHVSALKRIVGRHVAVSLQHRLAGLLGVERPIPLELVKEPMRPDVFADAN